MVDRGLGYLLPNYEKKDILSRVILASFDGFLIHTMIGLDLPLMEPRRSHEEKQ
jgi:hypothetical protein